MDGQLFYHSTGRITRFVLWEVQAMSLSQKIAAELDDFMKTSASPQCVTAEEGPHKLGLDVARATSIGIECTGLNFQVSDREPMPLKDLKAWGDRVAKKVTYLLEPLAMHEADAQSNEVVLRSITPSAKAERRSYYEARLKGSGTFNLDRITFHEQGKKRESVPCQFTNEVVERLVDDLVATSP
jgi:hypothetical protein